MSKPITMKQVGKGMLLSLSAQFVSLLISFLLNLIVPRFIDEYQYAYWQSYLLYVSYVGILHFGLLDGIVLRYSQFDYEELDKKLVRSQFVSLFLLDSFFSFCTLLISNILFDGVSFQICIFLSIGIITRNIFTFTSYSFQITNRIKKYASLLLAQKLFYGIGIVIILFLGIKDFSYLCIIDLLADVFGIIIGSFSNKGLYFGTLPKLSIVFNETKNNLAAGIMLMIANWSSQFMTGSAKMIVQWHWHALTFGKVSFAFSVSNLFLTFVTAISVVLFPSLKRVNEQVLPDIYKKLRGILSPVLLYMLILYYPGCLFLKNWLPKYSDSLVYLGILLPLIVYSSKVSLLTNNYLKAYRKEKLMLIINLVCVASGILSYAFFAYIVDSLLLLLISLVIIVMIRSVVSECVVAKILRLQLNRALIIESIVSILFIIITYYFSFGFGFLLYFFVLIMYSITIKGDLSFVKSDIKGLN